MNRVLLSNLVLACAALASPLAWQAAAAQPKEADKPPDKILTLGSGPASGEQITKEQLRECLAMPARLSVEADKAKRASADVEGDKAEFDRFDAQLKNERSKVDPKDRAAIAAYNAKLEKRQKMVTAFNAKSAAAAERVESYNALRKSWESGCENRPYSQRDYAELRPVKSAASSEPARTELRVVQPQGASEAGK
jgi:hypothetical protein